jgi:hypothetical protein
VPEVRRDFHFIFGLAPQTEPLHVVHYLCLASCLATQAPSALHFHCRHRPYGEWWERIAPQLDVHTVADTPLADLTTRYDATKEGRYIRDHGLTYAHEADFLRLAILGEAGGAYVDMDTLFVARYPDELFAAEFAIGEESSYADAKTILRPSLCNAVMFAQPGATFATRWLERMATVFDGTWNRHSCAEAGLLWASGAPLTVLPRHWFDAYDFTRDDLEALLTGNEADRDGILSIHLWAHLWWSAARNDFLSISGADLTPQAIARGGFTYARLAHRFLPADALR